MGVKLHLYILLFKLLSQLLPTYPLPLFHHADSTQCYFWRLEILFTLKRVIQNKTEKKNDEKGIKVKEKVNFIKKKN